MAISIMPALKIINADLERESNKLHYVVENDFQKKRQTRKDLHRTEMKRNASSKRRNGDRVSNLFEVENGDSEIVLMYKQILKLIFLPAAIMIGVIANYNWKPARQFRVWFALSSLAFCWVCFLFTQYVHIRSPKIEEKMKVLEVCAVYGIGLSVYSFGLAL